jgi:hypothetical protein
MSTTAVLITAVAAFAAGWVGRSRRGRRLERSRTAKSLRARLGSEAWLLRALAVIRGEMRDDERAVNITVITRNGLRDRIAYGIDFGAPMPVRALVTDCVIDGEPAFEFHDLTVEDDPSALGEAL